MDRLLVRPSEAAEILGLGRSKVYAMLATGELPCVKIGKSVRVPLDALHRWVNARTYVPEARDQADQDALRVAPTLDQRNRGQGAADGANRGAEVRLRRPS